MTTVTAQDVRDLREITNETALACHQALNQSNGDVDGALQFLRKRPSLETRVAALEAQVRDLMEAARKQRVSEGLEW